MKKAFSLSALALFASFPLKAQPTGAAFLRLDAGARAAGMGSAFTAVADDATAAFWNPAGLAWTDRREVSATHSDWIGDVRLDHLAYVHPVGKTAFAGSLAYLSQGRLEARGDDRRDLGTFQADDAAAALSIGRALSSRSSFGFTARWIEQRIADARASGPAVDAGFLADAGPRLRVGAALRNWGPPLKMAGQSYALPTTVSLGARFRLVEGFSIASDARRPTRAGKTVFSLGTEYWLMGRVALRAGYLTAGVLQSTPWSMQMGLGLKIASYQVDYALTPAGEFGSVQRLSLSARF